MNYVIIYLQDKRKSERARAEESKRVRQRIERLPKDGTARPYFGREIQIIKSNLLN